MLGNLFETAKSYLFSQKMKIFTTISGYQPMPSEENGISFEQKFVADDVVEIVRASCGKAVRAICEDFNEPQVFTFKEPHCGQFTVHCGPQVVETYFDPTKNIPTVQNIAEAAQQGFDTSLNPWRYIYNALPDMQNMFSHFLDKEKQNSFLSSTNSTQSTLQAGAHDLVVYGESQGFFNGVLDLASQGFDMALTPFRYAQDITVHAKNGIMDTMYSLFNSAPNPAALPASKSSESDDSWWYMIGKKLGLIEDTQVAEIICPWQDYQCHYENLSAEFTQCDAMSCYWDTIKEYLGKYDMNAIMQDIYQNYLPEQEDAIKIAIGTTLVVATTVTGYLLYRSYRNNQQKIKEAQANENFDKMMDSLPSSAVSSHLGDDNFDEMLKSVGVDETGDNKHKNVNPDDAFDDLVSSSTGEIGNQKRKKTK